MSKLHSFGRKVDSQAVNLLRVAITSGSISQRQPRVDIATPQPNRAPSTVISEATPRQASLGSPHAQTVLLASLRKTVLDEERVEVRGGKVCKQNGKQYTLQKLDPPERSVCVWTRILLSFDLCIHHSFPDHDVVERLAQECLVEAITYKKVENGLGALTKLYDQYSYHSLRSSTITK